MIEARCILLWLRNLELIAKRLRKYFDWAGGFGWSDTQGRIEIENGYHKIFEKIIGVSPPIALLKISVLAPTIVRGISFFP